jgi:hypothetical protein
MLAQIEHIRFADDGLPREVSADGLIEVPHPGFVRREEDEGLIYRRLPIDTTKTVRPPSC